MALKWAISLAPQVELCRCSRTRVAFVVTPCLWSMRNQKGLGLLVDMIFWICLSIATRGGRGASESMEVKQPWLASRAAPRNEEQPDDDPPCLVTCTLGSPPRLGPFFPVPPILFHSFVTLKAFAFVLSFSFCHSFYNEVTLLHRGTVAVGRPRMGRKISRVG
jgi:hypothetical protein